MVVIKRIKPKQATIKPAITAIKYSRMVNNRACLDASAKSAVLPDIPAMTINVMVDAMPKDMVVPSKIPSQVKSMDMANSITMTTPGQGITPTAIAVIKGLEKILVRGLCCIALFLIHLIIVVKNINSPRQVIKE